MCAQYSALCVIPTLVTVLSLIRPAVRASLPQLHSVALATFCRAIASAAVPSLWCGITFLLPQRIQLLFSFPFLFFSFQFFVLLLLLLYDNYSNISVYLCVSGEFICCLARYFANTLTYVYPFHFPHALLHLYIHTYIYVVVSSRRLASLLAYLPAWLLLGPIRLCHQWQHTQLHFCRHCILPWFFHIPPFRQPSIFMSSLLCAFFLILLLLLSYFHIFGCGSVVFRW